jgi:hypothetical protein
VLLAGFLGGSLCAVIILVTSWGFVFQPVQENLNPLFLFGAESGGVFGIFAFPACYYTLLKSTPFKLALAVTIPATIIIGSVGEYFYVHHVSGTGQSDVSLLMGFYGPSFLGLLLSSIALNLFAPKVVRSG